MKRTAFTVLACLCAGGCSTTPADLNAKTEATTQVYPENYQEIYRRVSTTAKRCIAGNVSAYASFAVDTELYPDLGFGELTASLINMGIRNYYWSVKIEKFERGAKLTVRSGNTLAAEKAKQNILRWASGDPEC